MNDFFANWYELFGLIEGFSDDMYNQQLYVPTGFCMVLIPIICLTLYYYVFNSVRFNKWWQWLIIVLVLCVVNFSISFGVSYRGILTEYLANKSLPEYPLAIDSFTFAVISTFWCFAIAFVWSLIIKWGSSHCRRTPF